MFCKIHSSNVSFTFDTFLNQNVTFFASSFIAILRNDQLFLISKIRIIFIFAASITSAPLTC